VTSRPRPPTASRLGSSAYRARTEGNGDAGRAPSTLGSPPAPALTDWRTPFEVLDGVIRSIFSIALTLSASGSLTEAHAGASLENALEELDDLVRELRHSAFATHLPAGTPPLVGVQPAERRTTAAESALHLVDQAAHALTEVDGVLIRLWTDAVVDTDHDPSARERIVNAARLVHLARVTLTATAVG